MLIELFRAVHHFGLFRAVHHFGLEIAPPIGPHGYGMPITVNIHGMLITLHDFRMLFTSFPVHTLNILPALGRVQLRAHAPPLLRLGQGPMVH